MGSGIGPRKPRRLGCELLERRLLLKTPFLIADLLAAEADGSDGVAIHSNVNGDSFGFALSADGDFNKDGIDDLLIGAPDDPSGSAVYVIFGTHDRAAEFDPATLDGTNGFKVGTSDRSKSLGTTVGNAGDVNGDGIDDIIVGAPGGGLSDRRSAFVVFGRRDGQPAFIDVTTLDLTNGFVIYAPGGSSQFGVRVAGVGDVNADGFDDVAVSPAYGGAGYVVFGKAEFTSDIDLGTTTSDEALKVSGFDSGLMVTFAGLGDVNGDTRDDVAILALEANSSLTHATDCDVRVLYGTNEPFTGAVNATVIDAAHGALFRSELDRLGSCVTPFKTVAAAGDVNGDGINDLITGAPGRYVNDVPSAGSAFVVFGRQGGLGLNLSVDQLDGSNGFAVVSQLQFGFLGKSVAGAVDINADGFDDVVVGSPDAAVGGATRAGKAYVIFGGVSAPSAYSAEQLTGLNGFEVQGAMAEDRSATAIAGGGDTDGDGIDDLLIGAPRRSDDTAGQVYVIRGRDFVGELPRLALGDAVTTEATDRLRFELSDAFQYPTLAISVTGEQEEVVEVTNPVEAVTGDFNGDGLVDFAVLQPSGLKISANESVVAVMLNNGDETFRPTPANSVLADSQSLQTVDVDNDGDIDLATLNRTQGSISVLRNRGDGTFFNALSFSVGEFPTVLRFADLDGDLLPEAIVNQTATTKNISVLQNLGGGFFAAPNSTPFDNTPTTFAVEDVDADGDLDIVVANSGNGQKVSFHNSITVLANDGNGHLTKASELVTGLDGFVSAVPASVAMGDVNGDGHQDVVVVEADFSSSPRGAGWIAFGNGNGTFRNAQFLDVRPGPRQVYIQDLNGDDHLDLLINSDDDTFSQWINSGDGTFQRHVELVGVPGAAFGLVADFDDDGDFDVIRLSLGNEGSVLSGIERIPGQLEVFRNDGAGRLDGGASWRVGPRPQGLAYGDFDLDGDVDIAVANSGSSQGTAVGAGDAISLLWNDGNGLFSTRSDFAANRNPGPIVSADFNGDGFLDIAAINKSDEVVSVLLNDKSGGLSAPLAYGPIGDAVAIDVGDLDGDGDIDLLVVSDFDRKLSVLLNNGNAIFASVRLGLPTRGVSQRVTRGTDLQVIDIDRDGHLDVVLGLVDSTTGTVSVLFGSGDGTFAVTIDPPLAGRQIAVDDFDGDAQLDIAAIESIFGRTTLSLSFSSTNRQFSDAVTHVFAASATSVSSQDIDLDGDADLIITDGLTAVLGSGSGALRVLLNDGVGGFTDPRLFPVGIRPSHAIVTDLTGDGLPELATVNLNSNDVTVYENVSIGVTELQFPVTLSHALDRDVTFSFRSDPVTALAMFDYQSRTGTILITAGQTTAEVTIQVDNDPFDELSEQLTMTLFDPVNATILDARGEGADYRQRCVPACDA